MPFIVTIDFPGGKSNRIVKIRAQLKILKSNAKIMKTDKHVKMKFQFNSNVSSLFVQHLRSNRLQVSNSI